jgi:ribosome-associated protein YbcJ (S4-like RNA binding protein)
VKRILALDDVTVNGEVEHRRGRQLTRGDEVGLGGEVYRVA